MSKRISPDWEAVRADYLARDLTLEQICRRHGLSRSSLIRARSRFGWPMRRAASAEMAGGEEPGPARKRLISRLFLVLEKQVECMENRIAGEADDKEIALLGHLVRNLEKLVELDRKQQDDGPGKTRPPSPEMQMLRKKLSRRLDQLEGK